MCWKILYLTSHCIYRFGGPHSHPDPYRVQLCGEGQIKGQCAILGPALYSAKCHFCNYEYISGEDGSITEFKSKWRYVDNDGSPREIEGKAKNEHMQGDDSLHVKIIKGQAWFGSAIEFR